MEREETIGIIKSFVKSGLVPSRGTETYLHSGYFVNCFEHAFLNLTNKQLAMIDAGPNTRPIFGDLATGFWIDNPVPIIEQNVLELADEIGLKVSCDKGSLLKLNKNQWKIALYAGEAYWHFALNEKDGTWSAKEGWTPAITSFNNLTESYLNDPSQFAPKLKRTYIITNPYAENE